MDSLEDNGKSIAGKISNNTWNFLKANKILLIIPFLSIMFNLILIYIILILSETNFYLGIVILYFLINFTGIFFNSVIVAYIKLYTEGEFRSFWKSINIALSNIDKIIYWSLYQSVVGYIIATLESIKFLKIFVIGAEITWAIVTYFVVPIIIIEDIPVGDAVAKSKNLIKNYWKEGLKGEFILSSFSFITFLVLIVIFVWVKNSSFQYASNYVAIFGAAILFISIIINSALIQIYNTNLYIFLKRK